MLGSPLKRGRGKRKKKKRKRTAAAGRLPAQLQGRPRPQPVRQNTLTARDSQAHRDDSPNALQARRVGGQTAETETHQFHPVFVE